MAIPKVPGTHYCPATSLPGNNMHRESDAQKSCSDCPETFYNSLRRQVVR